MNRHKISFSMDMSLAEIQLSGDENGENRLKEDIGM